MGNRLALKILTWAQWTVLRSAECSRLPEFINQSWSANSLIEYWIFANSYTNWAWKIDLSGRLFGREIIHTIQMKTQMKNQVKTHEKIKYLPVSASLVKSPSSHSWCLTVTTINMLDVYQLKQMNLWSSQRFQHIVLKISLNISRNKVNGMAGLSEAIRRLY